MVLDKSFPVMLQRLEEAIEEACKEGDLQFNLRYSRVVQSSSEIDDYLSVHFKEAIPELLANEKLERKKRIRIGRLRFNNVVVPLDFAGIYFNQRNYYALASSVLESAKILLNHIGYFERMGLKITVFGTDYYQKFKFSNKKIPEAPIIYHTDHLPSRNWRLYVKRYRELEPQKLF